MARVKMSFIGSEGVEKFVAEAYNYGYSVGPRGEWRMVISLEEREVLAHKDVEVQIEPIKIPEGSIIFPCIVQRNALGYLAGLTRQGKPKKIEEEREFDMAVFHPIRDGTIEYGELLGVVNILYAKAEVRLVEAYEKWIAERYRFFH